MQTIANRRFFALLALLASLAILAVVGYNLAVTARGGQAAPLGTDLGGDPAPDFALTNQFGQRVSLNEQRGKVVVLTFLYTNCPDVCPLTTARLRTVYDRLGSEAEKAAFLAVSVDPEHDTIEAAYAFSERFNMLDRWSYLVGSREELEPVWKAYYIGVIEDHQHDEIRHNAPLYLIDQDGRRQILHTTGGETDAIIDEVVHDIRLLLDR